MTEQNWTLVIHGGAGVIRRERTSPESDSGVRAALHRALAAGSAILATGGASLAAGSVAGGTATRNPVTLARAVMEQSAHVLLGREGADAFSADHGRDQAGADWFVIPERRRQLDELIAGGGKFDVDMKYGTVGAAVAR